MAERLAPLEFSQAMGQHAFKGFDRFTEAFDPLRQLVSGHAIRGHHRLERLTINMNLRLTASGVVSIELAGECRLAGAQLIQQLG